MSRRPARELKFRLGCPLALALAVGGAVIVEALVYGRPFYVDFWDRIVPLGLFTGFPFGVLALAKARDWVAWLLAAGLMAVVWLSSDYMIESSTDFMSGIPFTMAPLAVAGLCLAVAGMRGRIGWGSEGDEEGWG
jgi:hypothetical protein